MPVHIYNDEGDDIETISECSPGEWELPTQIGKLEEWLKTNHKVIPKGKYVADIGFKVRKNATGGGAVISAEMIRILDDLGMEVYLSEYGYDFSDVE
ncbi:hypothetical protein [Nostoc sp. FACHB-888]|uniref:hypothetical protein n=1 Tax=Nostoc sp. FACHB-888 TaxID=2692842 RepID=UPI001686B991|nr:hypothetical protein [Nostoc sp. FACHB-888]MBD2246232.1 hypothetical protein [Nostoc sp. FACHB-888]